MILARIEMYNYPGLRLQNLCISRVNSSSMYIYRVKVTSQSHHTCTNGQNTIVLSRFIRHLNVDCEWQLFVGGPRAINTTRRHYVRELYDFIYILLEIRWNLCAFFRSVRRCFSGRSRSRTIPKL